MSDNRDTGLVSFSANFEPQVAGPLDARGVSKNYASIILEETWLANDGSSYAYKGMTTVVTDNPDETKNGLYRLKNLPVTDINNWVYVENTGSGEIVLPDGMITIKGRVDTIDDLPTTDLKNGDMYLVGLEDASVFDKYVYIEANTRFELLGSSEGEVLYNSVTAIPEDIGGIKAGTVYIDTPIEKVIDDLINPEKNPVLVVPSAGLQLSKLVSVESKLPPILSSEGTEGDPYFIDSSSSGYLGHEVFNVTNPDPSSPDWINAIPNIGLIYIHFQENCVLSSIQMKNAVIESHELVTPGIGAIQNYSIVGVGVGGDRTTIHEGTNSDFTPGAEWEIVIPEYVGEYAEYRFSISSTGPENTRHPAAAYIIPVLVSRNPITGNFVEIGSTFDLELSSNFNQGSITPAYTTSGKRSGLANSVTYTGTSAPTDPIAIADASELPNVQSLTGITATSGAMSWTAAFSYLEGEQPLSSKGNDFDSPLAAGSTDPASITVTGVYPYFATTSSTASTTKQPLGVIGAYYEIEVAGESDTDKQAIEYQSTASNALKGIEYYNTIAGEWVWLNSSKAASLTLFTESEVTKNINGTDVTYRKYTHNGSKIGSRKLRFHI